MLTAVRRRGASAGARPFSLIDNGFATTSLDAYLLYPAAQPGDLVVVLGTWEDHWNTVTFTVDAGLGNPELFFYEYGAANQNKTVAAAYLLDNPPAEIAVTPSEIMQGRVHMNVFRPPLGRSFSNVPAANEVQRFTGVHSDNWVAPPALLMEDNQMLFAFSTWNVAFTDDHYVDTENAQGDLQQLYRYEATSYDLGLGGWWLPAPCVDGVNSDFRGSSSSASNYPMSMILGHLGFHTEAV